VKLTAQPPDPPRRQGPTPGRDALRSSPHTEPGALASPIRFGTDRIALAQATTSVTTLRHLRRSTAP